MAATRTKSTSRLDKPDFSAAADAAITGKEQHSQGKKKAGRPSKGEVQRISLSIPKDLYDQMEAGASLLYKGNKTAYITALIRKDVKENQKKYEELINLRDGK